MENEVDDASEVKEHEQQPDENISTAKTLPTIQDLYKTINLLYMGVESVQEGLRGTKLKSNSLREIATNKFTTEFVFPGFDKFQKDYDSYLVSGGKNTLDQVLERTSIYRTNLTKAIKSFNDADKLSLSDTISLPTSVTSLIGLLGTKLTTLNEIAEKLTIAASLLPYENPLVTRIRQKKETSETNGLRLEQVNKDIEKLEQRLEVYQEEVFKAYEKSLTDAEGKVERLDKLLEAAGTKTIGGTYEQEADNARGRYQTDRNLFLLFGGIAIAVSVWFFNLLMCDNCENGVLEVSTGLIITKVSILVITLSIATWFGREAEKNRKACETLTNRWLGINALQNIAATFNDETRNKMNEQLAQSILETENPTNESNQQAFTTVIDNLFTAIKDWKNK